MTRNSWDLSEVLRGRGCHSQCPYKKSPMAPVRVRQWKNSGRALRKAWSFDGDPVLSANL